MATGEHLENLQNIKENINAHMNTFGVFPEYRKIIFLNVNI